MTEYTSTDWDPHTHTNINKLEKVQRHLAHYVAGDYTYNGSITNILHDLQRLT